MGYSIKKLISTKLTRYEFLVYLGALILGISGISSLIKSLTQISPFDKKAKALSHTSKQKTVGYGLGSYGV